MHPDLIVMLTHNDITVKDAAAKFDTMKDSPIKYWGFKDIGLAFDEMKYLVEMMKNANKTTILEVVSLSEEDCMQAAKLAAELEIDMLMGTVYYDSINDFMKNTQVKYLPFAGNVHSHPSILDGSIEEIVKNVNILDAKGVDGIDLLTYRYTGNPVTLINEVVNATKLPVVSAGSIDSYTRISEVSKAGVWSFTIGSAFFDEAFSPGGSFKDNVMNVWKWLNGNNIS